MVRDMGNHGEIEFFTFDSSSVKVSFKATEENMIKIVKKKVMTRLDILKGRAAISNNIL